MVQKTTQRIHPARAQHPLSAPASGVRTVQHRFVLPLAALFCLCFLCSLLFKRTESPFADDISRKFKFRSRLVTFSHVWSSSAIAHSSVSALCSQISTSCSPNFCSCPARAPKPGVKKCNKVQKSAEKCSPAPFLSQWTGMLRPNGFPRNCTLLSQDRFSGSRQDERCPVTG
jgi:hypothetical protein